MSNHPTVFPHEAADRLSIRELVEAYAHCADRAMREIGYRGMSMEAVARRAGVGKAALYRRGHPSAR